MPLSLHGLSTAFVDNPSALITIQNHFMRLNPIFFKALCLTIVVALSQLSYAANNKAFMWKVQYQATTLYLVGSIHALTEKHYPLPKPYTEAFAKADRLAVELDPEALNPQTSARLVQSKMWLPQGVSLATYLTTEQQEILKTFAEKNGSDFARLLSLRPWMLVEQLTQAQLKDSQYKPEFGLDIYFLNQAKQRRLPILEIESLQQQISAIADAPFSAQLAMLKTSLEQMDDQEYMAQMTHFWENADADGLYQFVYQDVIDNPALKPVMESLLDQRNRRMADVIGIYLGQYASRPNTMVVVIGALHLSGPNSVIKELERKGYIVQPSFTSS